MTKRIVSLVALALLCFGLFGCEKIDLSGGAGGSEGDPNVLIVRTVISGSETFRPEGGVSTKTDRILALITKVEGELGITVDAQVVSADRLQTQFLRAARSGNKYADLIQADAMFISRYYHEGYFLSLEEAGLSASQSGVLSYEGVPFALRADGWYNPLPSLSYLMFYNQAILSQSGCESPLELYEGGYWNWTEFCKLCRQVTAANSGEIFAIAAPTKAETSLIWATLHAAGARYFDADGTCVMDSSQAYNGFSKLQSFLKSGVTYSLSSDIYNDADPTAQLAFTNRRTAFFVGSSAYLFRADDESLPSVLGEDLRIIPFPAIVKNVAGAAFSKDDVFCAVTSLANKDLCGRVLPSLFSEPEGVDVLSEFRDEYFYHEKDFEIYQNLLSSADTETNLLMTENFSMVEDFFYQVAYGGSAKEILGNLQTIFNSQQKG